MSMSAYEVTIPTMLRGLGVLDHYLDEASKLTASHDKSITDVLGARLAPDMLNFAEQINIACSKAERHAAALCQLDRPATFPVEPTLEALRTRLRETQRFLESLPQADFSGAETRIYWLSEPLVDGWLCASDYVLQLGCARLPISCCDGACDFASSGILHWQTRLSWSVEHESQWVRLGACLSSH